MQEEYNNEAVGEETPYESYMITLEESVDTAVPIMVNRIKTRLSFLELAGASKEHLENSKKKWIGDILSFLTDKGILNKDSKESLMGIL